MTARSSLERKLQHTHREFRDTHKPFDDVGHGGLLLALPGFRVHGPDFGTYPCYDII